jgi:hypothetical protein
MELLMSCGYVYAQNGLDTVVVETATPAGIWKAMLAARPGRDENA